MAEALTEESVRKERRTVQCSLTAQRANGKHRRCRARGASGATLTGTRDEVRRGATGNRQLEADLSHIQRTFMRFRMHDLRYPCGSRRGQSGQSRLNALVRLQRRGHTHHARHGAGEIRRDDAEDGVAEAILGLDEREHGGELAIFGNVVRHCPVETM